ncbi:hypothetical protein [Streptomyces sp. NBC_00120]|uniref:Uncharacterized protein n=1 Tax=Streptomyces sp. NBC_00119 TaxID=2975659 RepID=A0AAU1U0J3_9ACTN|nr:hypothetical protein [Streptomyces sp. NBC_00120]MCX5323305.1 hypothetical protein [Streptomyces sp. NBC_00120]
MSAAYAVEPSGLAEWCGAVVGVGWPQRAGDRVELLVPPNKVAGGPSGLLESAAADAAADEAGLDKAFPDLCQDGTAGEGPSPSRP